MVSDEVYMRGSLRTNEVVLVSYLYGIEDIRVGIDFGISQRVNNQFFVFFMSEIFFGFDEKKPYL